MPQQPTDMRQQPASFCDGRPNTVQLDELRSKIGRLWLAVTNIQGEEIPTWRLCQGHHQIYRMFDIDPDSQSVSQCLANMSSGNEGYIPDFRV
jgi:hypothetical protein